MDLYVTKMEIYWLKLGLCKFKMCLNWFKMGLYVFNLKHANFAKSKSHCFVELGPNLFLIRADMTKKCTSVSESFAVFLKLDQVFRFVSDLEHQPTHLHQNNNEDYFFKPD